MEALAEGDDAESVARFVEAVRNMNTTIARIMGAAPEFQPYLKEITTSEVRVPTTHDGEHEVVVEVYTPLTLSNPAPCYIYAHGGGCIAGSAAESRPFMAHIAVSCSVVVFNVDYRLAPETRCPNNVLDFYESVKYISSHAEELGVDPTRVCIGGESGGGYVCQGAAVLLAQRGEAHLVKLLLPGIPMTSDYYFSDPSKMSGDERDNRKEIQRLWRTISSDFEGQRNSPLLFPGKTPDATLSQFPPTVIYLGDQDLFISEAREMAGRLEKEGRLLELIVFPGAKHITCLEPGFRVGEVFEGAIKRVMEKYLK